MTQLKDAGNGWFIWPDGRMRRLTNGLWKAAGKNQPPFLARKYYVRRFKRRKKVSPSQSRFNRRQPHNIIRDVVYVRSLLTMNPLEG